jgi:hypothetical protein
MFRYLQMVEREVDVGFECLLDQNGEIISMDTTYFKLNCYVFYRMYPPIKQTRFHFNASRVRNLIYIGKYKSHVFICCLSLLPIY